MASRRVTFVCAPDIPPDELTALEGLLKASIDDPTIPAVVNYPASVENIFVGVNPLLITAPDVPNDTLDGLRKKFNDPTINLIVVNYPVAILEF